MKFNLVHKFKIGIGTETDLKDEKGQNADNDSYRVIPAESSGFEADQLW
jgi:hypothetical protein